MSFLQSPELSFPDFGGVSSAVRLVVAVAAPSAWRCGQEAACHLGRWLGHVQRQVQQQVSTSTAGHTVEVNIGLF